MGARSPWCRVLDYLDHHWPDVVSRLHDSLKSKYSTNLYCSILAPKELCSVAWATLPRLRLLETRLPPTTEVIIYACWKSGRQLLSFDMRYDYRSYDPFFEGSEISKSRWQGQFFRVWLATTPIRVYTCMPPLPFGFVLPSFLGHLRFFNTEHQPRQAWPDRWSMGSLQPTRPITSIAKHGARVD